MVTYYTLKDARINMSKIVDAVYYKGDEAVITKFGDPRVKMTTLKDSTLVSSLATDAEREEASRSVVGLWSDRVDMADSVAWVRKLRERRVNG